MIENLINLTYSHYDRFISGRAVPTESHLKLETIDALNLKTF